MCEITKIFGPPSLTLSLTLKMNTKKLIDHVETCVDDMVVGLMYADPRLVRLEKLNVLLRRDIAQVKQSQVTLLSGGGSGHEPAHAGYIGDGMLSGAVLGNVFASPSVSSILAAIRAAAGPKGLVLIVKNYTGDRLNFGMAMEKAKQEGFRVAMVVVDDDVALPKGKGITGGRGIAGTVFMHKVAGAVAASGGSLEDVLRAADRLATAMGTLGIALSTCSLPGSTAHTDRLSAALSCEVGMGIHGEPGREQRLLPAQGAASFVADLLVEGVLARLPTAANDRIVVLLNNLGALPAMEMATMTKAVVEQLQRRHLLQVERVFCGPFMTSLDMSGMSVTVLKVDQELLDYLDLPTAAPAWLPAAAQGQGISERTLSLPLQACSASSAQCNLCISMNATALALAVCNAIIAAEGRLTALDAISGDGDCGIVMKRGADEVTAVMKRLQGESVDAVKFCSELADAIGRAMGGTSGVLLEIMFRAMASSLGEQATAVVTKEVASSLHWSTAFHAGVQSVQRCGGAEAGMRTMLDALLPAATVLMEGGDLNHAADAAEQGAEATKQMQSVAGRANYVSFELLQGHADPGASAVAIAFAAMKDCMLLLS